MTSLELQAWKRYADVNDFSPSERINDQLFDALQGTLGFELCKFEVSLRRFGRSIMAGIKKAVKR